MSEFNPLMLKAAKSSLVHALMKNAFRQGSGGALRYRGEGRLLEGEVLIITLSITLLLIYCKL